MTEEYKNNEDDDGEVQEKDVVRRALRKMGMNPDTPYN